MLLWRLKLVRQAGHCSTLLYTLLIHMKASECMVLADVTERLSELLLSAITHSYRVLVHLKLEAEHTACPEAAAIACAWIRVCKA
jgi:hypothetical protein